MKTRSRCFFAPMFVSILAAGLHAQGTYGLPANVPLIPPLPAGTSPLTGGVLTPDSRVLLYSQPDNTVGNGGWFATVVRHESITRNAAGTPDFLAPGVWSYPPVQFAFDHPPPSWGYPADGFDYYCVHQWFTAAPDPAFAQYPVPFRSDQGGNYAAQGAFDTYRLVIVAPVAWPLDASVPLSLTQPTWGPKPPLGVVPPHWTFMARRDLQIVVSSPRTSSAAIHSAQILDQAAQFTSNFLTWTSPSGPKPIFGIEPSITSDGRLLIFQGNPGNSAIGPTLIGQSQSRIMYSWNSTPFGLTGWSEPRMLSLMNPQDAATMIAGRRFDERYPVAKNRLFDAGGSPVLGEYWGAYPWISLDGTDVLHTTVGRAGLSLIGRSTGWKLQHIDGPLNMDRQSTQRFVFTGTGVAPGTWSPARDLLAPPLPYTRSRFVMPLFGTNPTVYGEAALEEHLDGDYVVALPMNESIGRDYATGLEDWIFQTDQTPDVSGLGATGLLENGAAFRQEIDQRDIYEGAIGACIRFPDSGRVRVPTPAGSAAQLAKQEMSVELFVFDPSISSSIPGMRVLAHHPGSWALGLDRNGSVLAAVQVAGGTFNTGSTAPVIPASSWTHIALTYRTALSGNDTMEIYVGGQLAGSMVFPRSGANVIAAAAGDLIVGPDGQFPPYDDGSLKIDEFKYSRVVRTADEIARHAHCPPPATSWAASPTLPTGLVAAATRIPSTHPFTAAAVNLGETLFHDPGLSTNNMSCATCHVRNLGFTDGLPTASGNGGSALARNTPSIVNRIFSTHQFWNGRAPDLETQALIPILSADEMAQPSITPVLAYLNAPGPGAPNYPALFATVYGGPATAENLAQALASFQRAIVSGGSPFDLHEAGAAPLSGSALAGRDLFFGRARCFSCHHGTNLTDEDFHVTLLNDGDAGRGAITNRVYDAHRFKTPTLRNVSATAPYFHNGSAPTLAAVVARYNAGSARADGLEPAPVSWTRG